MRESLNCIKCKKPIQEKKIIFIRCQVKEKWGSHPVCERCWFKDNPDREPIRMVVEN